jgi:hypothetical protein
MERALSWEADNTQKGNRFLQFMEPKDLLYTHNNPILGSVLDQIIPYTRSCSNVSVISFHIIVPPSTPRSFKWPPPFWSTNNFCTNLSRSHACYISNFIIITEEKYILWSFSICAFSILLLLPLWEVPMFCLALCSQSPSVSVAVRGQFSFPR